MRLIIINSQSKFISRFELLFNTFIFILVHVFLRTNEICEYTCVKQKFFK